MNFPAPDFLDGSRQAPPNASVSDGDRDGSYPQGMGANAMPTPPNASGDRRGGTMPLGGQAPTVMPYNSRAVPIGHSSQR